MEMEKKCVIPLIDTIPQLRLKTCWKHSMFPYKSKKYFSFVRETKKDQSKI